MTIIIALGIGAVTFAILEQYPLVKFQPTKEYDSPKDQDYYAIGAKLNELNQEAVIPPTQNSLVLVEVIEETNTYIWGNVKDVETIDYS